MIIQLGSGATECLVNTDKILTATRLNLADSTVLFVNGTEANVALSYDTLAEVPGFHAVEVYQGSSGRVVEVMVNMSQLIDARATPNDGVSYLSLAQDPGVDGNSLKLRVAMTISQIAELLRDQASPAPRM